MGVVDNNVWQDYKALTTQIFQTTNHLITRPLPVLTVDGNELSLFCQGIPPYSYNKYYSSEVITFNVFSWEAVLVEIQTQHLPTNELRVCWMYNLLNITKKGEDNKLFQFFLLVLYSARFTIFDTIICSQDSV